MLDKITHYPKTFFVTGTDTDCGKTLLTAAALKAAGQAGLSTAGVKPVAAGCVSTPEGLRNSDALQILQAMTMKLSYSEVNPVALKAAIAPHIAAVRENETLSVANLVQACQNVIDQGADLTLIEGAGGWRVPLNKHEMLSDLVKHLNLPVLLVVGMRLGCLNHAFLTAQAIEADGLTVAGWVANRIDCHMSCYEENYETLKSAFPFPCIGGVPFLSEPEASTASQYLDIQKLLLS